MKVEIEQTKVSKECKDLLVSSRKSSKRSIELFIRGIKVGLHDIDPNWAKGSPKEIKRTFNKVFRIAHNLMVSESDGGGCKGAGLSPGTFRLYKSVAKKCHIFRCRWPLARRCSIATLQTAQEIKNESEEPKLKTAVELYKQELPEGRVVVADKMELAVDCLRRSRPKSRKYDTEWLLPEISGEDTLDESISIVFEYWDREELTGLISQYTPQAKAVRRAMTELRKYIETKN